jgi:hypothetical protein
MKFSRTISTFELKTLPFASSAEDVRVTPEIEGYTKNRAVVSGDGTWFPQIAKLADVLEDENKHVTVSAEDEWLQG